MSKPSPSPALVQALIDQHGGMPSPEAMAEFTEAMTQAALGIGAEVSPQMAELLASMPPEMQEHFELMQQDDTIVQIRKLEQELKQLEAQHEGLTQSATRNKDTQQLYAVKKRILEIDSAHRYALDETAQLRNAYFADHYIPTATSTAADTKPQSQKEKRPPTQKSAGKKYRCNHCAKEYPSSKQLRKCSRCHSVAYCNTKCQTADWPNHRVPCKVEDSCHKYSYSVGRVHPHEEEMLARLHPPLIRPGCPNPQSMEKYNKSKHGKKVCKAITKLALGIDKFGCANRAAAKKFAEITMFVFEFGTLVELETFYAENPTWRMSSGEDRGAHFIWEVLSSTGYGTHGYFSLITPKETLLLMDYWARIGGNLAGYDEGRGYTLLHTAAKWGQIKVMQFLIKEGVDPNVHTGNNSSGRSTSSTPLHLATMMCRPKSVEYLVGVKGVNVEARTNSGKTPMHYALSGVMGPELEECLSTPDNIRFILNVLKKGGGDINAAIKNDGGRHHQNGMTPLDQALYHSNGSTSVGLQWAAENGLQRGDGKAVKKFNKTTVKKLRKRFSKEEYPQYQELFQKMEDNKDLTGNTIVDALMAESQHW